MWFILGIMFLGGSFPRGNYLGDKSSKRHLGAISRGILSGANYLWDNFPGTIIQGLIIRRAIFLVGNCPGRNFPRGQLSLGVIVRGVIIRGAIIQGTIFRGAIDHLTDQLFLVLQVLLLFFVSCYRKITYNGSSH